MATETVEPVEAEEPERLTHFDWWAKWAEWKAKLHQTYRDEVASVFAADFIESWDIEAEAAHWQPAHLLSERGLVWTVGLAAPYFDVVTFRDRKLFAAIEGGDGRSFFVYAAKRDGAIERLVGEPRRRALVEAGLPSGRVLPAVEPADPREQE